ncbi:hypothetical protein [Thermoactinospora rubra]|uniref:hypothetical protein n=1 Tax=Thermoactinospora rubra TaxID=1088767 RepID=UPI000A0F405D|nr:hypothetical protein [Thermoactinospora rubra]
MARILALLVACAVLGVLGARHVTAAAPTTWRLVEIRWHRTDRTAVFEEVRKPDARGGEIRVSIPGDRYGLCPGGKEKLRFKWTFTRSLRTFTSGDYLTAGMRFRTESVAAPCEGELGARTSGTFVGANGMGNPFGARESLEMDAGFTRSVHKPGTGVPFVRPVPKSMCCATGRVSIAPSSYVPNRPRTWFAMLIETPGATNLVIYVYEVVRRQ